METMMKIASLENLLADELKDIYSAEVQMIKALPKMARAAASDDLRATLQNHLQQTQTHVQRLEGICNDLRIKPKGKKCAGMEGIIEEGKEMIQADADPEALEAALIGTAQRGEHYEIAAYGTARAHARQLGFMKVANLLGQTLDEEKQTDRTLTVLAENQVNVQASMSRTSIRAKEQTEFPTPG
jgi:ferritin-like metal-binding protein YciE